MSILSGFLKTVKYRLTDSGYLWQSEKTSSSSVIMGDGTDDTDTLEKRFGNLETKVLDLNCNNIEIHSNTAKIESSNSANYNVVSANLSRGLYIVIAEAWISPTASGLLRVGLYDSSNNAYGNDMSSYVVGNLGSQRIQSLYFINADTVKNIVLKIGQSTGVSHEVKGVIKWLQLKSYTTDPTAFEVSNVSSVYTYTGNEITPTPIIQVSGNVLIDGVDYKVSYKDNINVGTATVVITGIGNYVGSVKEVKFRISSKSLQGSTYEPIEDQVYNGVAITPDVTLKDDNGRELVRGTDYDLSYQNNSEPGKARVTIVGHGNYRGTLYIHFRIKVASISTLTYTDITSSSVTLSWSQDGVVTGYEIYRDNDGSGAYQRIARTAKTSYTDKNLLSKMNYTYMVSAYYLNVEGEIYYGDSSAELEVTTL